MSLKHWILPNNQFKTHLFFSNFGWGDPKGGSNLKTLWRRYLTSAIRPISYRIRFMARRSFFVFLIFFPLTGRGGGQALSGKFHYFFFEPFSNVVFVIDVADYIGLSCSK